MVISEALVSKSRPDERSTQPSGFPMMSRRHFETPPSSHILPSFMVRLNLFHGALELAASSGAFSPHGMPLSFCAGVCGSPRDSHSPDSNPRRSGGEVEKATGTANSKLPRNKSKEREFKRTARHPANFSRHSCRMFRAAWSTVYRSPGIVNNRMRHLTETCFMLSFYGIFDLNLCGNRLSSRILDKCWSAIHFTGS